MRTILLWALKATAAVKAQEISRAGIKPFQFLN
jgi:hypothetical protein